MYDIYFVLTVFIYMISAYNMIGVIISTLKIVQLTKSASAVKTAKQNGEDAVKCIDSTYILKKYIFSAVSECILMFIFLRTLHHINPKISSYISAAIINFAYISAILNLILATSVLFVAYSRGKYGYLTSEGLILPKKIHKFTNCRFVWDSTEASDKPSNTLHIYPPKKNIPITVVFDEQVQKAHEIVSVNQVNS